MILVLCGNVGNPDQVCKTKCDVLPQQPITKTPEMGEEGKVACNIVTVHCGRKRQGCLSLSQKNSA